MYQIFVVMMFEKVQLTKNIISRVNLPALAIGFRLATLFSRNDAGKGSGYARLTHSVAGSCLGEVTQDVPILITDHNFRVYL